MADPVKYMISYAQNREDVVLERAFKEQRDGFYIDVGAWDPDIDSVTKHFYLKGWTGINVEPTKYYYDRLTAARSRDVNLNVAVSRSSGRELFLEYAETGFSGLASDLDVAAINKTAYSSRVKKVEVEVMPLAEITRLYAPQRVDFLKIDVEGAEGQVIASGEWIAFRPRVIVVEALTPVDLKPAWFAWEHMLLNQGYNFALFDGLNRFYYRAEEPELHEKLSVPANVLDFYVPAELRVLQERVAELERQAGRR